VLSHKLDDREEFGEVPRESVILGSWAWLPDQYGAQGTAQGEEALAAALVAVIAANGQHRSAPWRGPSPSRATGLNVTAAPVA
jgi:hypothetical protein